MHVLNQHEIQLNMFYYSKCNIDPIMNTRISKSNIQSEFFEGADDQSDIVYSKSSTWHHFHPIHQYVEKCVEFKLAL